MPPKSRRSGGPKSPSGIAKASQNSIKHGLTAKVPTSPAELVMMESFAQELIDYYKPQSPLEKLQIERIALCRAKLARLYQVENARLDIEANKLASTPNQFFKEMPHVKGVVKGMTLEYIRFGSLTLPLGLTELELFQIATEVRSLQGKAVDEANLWALVPHLTQLIDRHLKELQPSEANKGSRLAQLETLLQNLKTIYENGENYLEQVKSLIAMFEPLDDFKDVDSDSDSKTELEEWIEAQQAAREAERAKRHPKTKAITQVDNEQEVSAKKFRQIMSQCQLWVQLYVDSQDAKRAYAQYQQTRDLLLKALALPSSEAELLLRYQSALERRLSQAIGELLELQRRR